MGCAVSTRPHLAFPDDQNLQASPTKGFKVPGIPGDQVSDFTQVSDAILRRPLGEDWHHIQPTFPAAGPAPDDQHCPGINEIGQHETLEQDCPVRARFVRWHPQTVARNGK